MKKNIKVAYRFILNLDLNAVMARVEGVSKTSLKKAENEYRHFLLMLWQSRYGNVGRGTIVPSKLADEVWHVHILHTKLYRQMCDRLFGKFVDHHPRDLSVRGVSDIEAEERTQIVDSSIPDSLRFIPRKKPSVGPAWCSTGAGGCTDCGD